MLIPICAQPRHVNYVRNLAPYLFPSENPVTMPRELRRICALIWVMIWLCAVCEAKNMAVVVDKTNSQPGITAADLVKVFKFDNRKWPDGRNVTVVLLEPSMPDMHTALEKLYHMQPDELRALLATHRA